jgi:hypothetical protein
MTAQDVTDASPVTFGGRGLNAFLVSPLTRDTFTPRPAPTAHTGDDDLSFFMTRSYQTLIYCDGGD